eukprot:gene5731-biopygen4936
MGALGQPNGCSWPTERADLRRVRGEARAETQRVVAEAEAAPPRPQALQEAPAAGEEKGMVRSIVNAVESDGWGCGMEGVPDTSDVRNGPDGFRSCHVRAKAAAAAGTSSTSRCPTVNIAHVIAGPSRVRFA